MLIIRQANGCEVAFISLLAGENDMRYLLYLFINPSCFKDFDILFLFYSTETEFASLFIGSRSLCLVSMIKFLQLLLMLP